MDAQSILLLLIASVNIALGIFIYHQDRRNPVNTSYAAFAWFVALWEASIAFFRFVVEPSYAILWMRAAYIGATGIGGSFLYFSLHFPYPQRFLQLKKVIVSLITITLLIAFLFPKFLVKKFIIQDGVKGVIVGQPELILFTIFFILALYGALISLFIHWRKSSGVVCYQIFYIFLSVLIAGIIGSITNLLFIFLNDYRFIWLGPLFSLIMVIATAYAIVKHHLMNIRVIVAEVLTISVILIMLLEFFLSKTGGEYLIRGFLVILVGIFGIFLIKSVINEVRRKEELQILSQKLELANEELKRLDQAKSEFLSIASHQLRTPLTAIKGYASMLLDGTYGKMTAKVREGVDKVSQSTQRMIDLVNDLLDTSRLESGRMEFKFEPIQLADLAAGVVDELIPKAKEKGLVIDWQKPAQVLPQIKADQTKLRQVVMNLVDNAIKYTEKGKVAVTLKQQGRDLIFSVKDSGAGLSKDEMSFLFKKFSRGRGEVSHIKGSGLGLYVARRIMEVHGGKIWAESAGLGKGSTFAFSLNLDWQPKFDGVYKPDGVK